MKILSANTKHLKYAQDICDTIESSAQVRGTGIAKRTPEYIKNKLESGNAVIALDDGKFAGFCYIETWENKSYVVHSGLIVHPDYRNQGLAKKIKTKVFNHSKEKYPNAKVFGITTGLAVMKINSDLGYKPVTFSEITQDDAFWNGCKSCKNYDILMRNERKMCLCTGMLYDPNAKTTQTGEEGSLFRKKFERLKSKFAKKK
ncbi:GNAT family N-acetyltransferase [Wenyingzhuangia sp. IMCC45574]